jgi:UDP-3-O-[3-hydroxymyristoyl] glucosamine N-acyltransferase
MKLQDIPDSQVPEGHLLHQVVKVATLDASAVDHHTLRWWDGRYRPEGEVLYGGVLLAPLGVDCSHISDVVVRTNTPRKTFALCLRELYPVHLPVKVLLGMGVYVHPSAVIGRDGFGYVDGEQVTHIGHVELHSRVSIGANACVDRGTVGNTIIDEDTKVDNLVHIAHNVRIGKRCQVVAGAVIGGSCIIGDDVFIGINASIRNGIRIGNGAVVGMGAVVTKDVAPGTTVVGNPARPL